MEDKVRDHTVQRGLYLRICGETFWKNCGCLRSGFPPFAKNAKDGLPAVTGLLKVGVNVIELNAVKDVGVAMNIGRDRAEGSIIAKNVPVIQSEGIFVRYFSPYLNERFSGLQVINIGIGQQMMFDAIRRIFLPYNGRFVIRPSPLDDGPYCLTNAGGGTCEDR